MIKVRFTFLIFIFFLIDLYDFNDPKSQNLDRKLCRCHGVKSKIRGRIVGGEEVDVDNFNIVASLFVKRGKDQIISVDSKTGNSSSDNETGQELMQHICMGIILNPSWILSTAYCAKEPKKHNLTIYAGAGNHDLKEIYASSKNYRQVSEIYFHPELTLVSISVNGKKQKYLKNDIALFELSSPFDLGDNSNIFPACFLNKQKYTFENSLTLASWGISRSLTTDLNHDANKSRFSKEEKNKTKLINNQTKLTLTSLKQGNKFDYKYYNFSFEEMILARNFHSSVCEGDRGSGLGINSKENKFYLVGLVDFFWSIKTGNILQRCILNSFSFSLPIYNYLNWINLVIGDDNMCLIDDALIN